jgi:hypothetical protein
VARRLIFVCFIEDTRLERLIPCWPFVQYRSAPQHYLKQKLPVEGVWPAPEVEAHSGVRTINKHNHNLNIGEPHSLSVLMIEFTWQGRAMSTLKHHRSVTWLTPCDIEKSQYDLRGVAKTPISQALNYYWPWALALAISGTIWLAIAWLIWTFV